MASIRLEDLIKEQQKMVALGSKNAQATLDRLEEIAKTTADSEKIHKQDRLLQVAQTFEAIKADKDDDRIVEATEKGLLEKTGDGLNANVLKLIDVIKGKSNPSQGSASGTVPEGQDGARAEQTRKVLEERSKEQAARYYPTFEERIGYKKPEEGSGIKGMFQSLMGMFKTGLKIENFVDMKSPPSGLIGADLRKEYDRENYIKDQLATGATTNPELASKRFDKVYSESRTLSETNKQIEEMRARGLTDDQIARTGQFDVVEKSLQKMSVADPLIREKYATTDRVEPVRPSQPAETRRSQSVRPEPVDVPTGALGSEQPIVSEEDQAENLRLMAEQTDILKRIEENTRLTANKPVPPPNQQPHDQQESESGGISDLLGMGTRGLRRAGRTIGRIGRQVLGGLRSAGGAIASRAAPLLSTVGGAVSSGVSKALPTISNVASKVFNVGSLAEVGGSILPKAASIGGEVATKAGGMLGKAGGLAKGILGKAALPLAAGMALYDGVTGYNKASENLGIEGREATFGEKLSSAGGSVLSGLSFGLLDEKSTSRGIASLFGAGPDVDNKTTPVQKAPMSDTMGLAPASKGAQVREQATKLGLDPNKAEGKFEGGSLTQIIDTSTGESYNVQVSPEQQRNVDAARLLRGAAQGSPVTPQPVPPRSADAVYNRSEENAAAAQSPKTSQAPVVISAPQTTNVQQTQNYLDRGSARNTESSWRDYNKSKYAY